MRQEDTTTRRGMIHKMIVQADMLFGMETVHITRKETGTDRGVDVRMGMKADMLPFLTFLGPTDFRQIWSRLFVADILVAVRCSCVMYPYM